MYQLFHLILVILLSHSACVFAQTSFAEAATRDIMEVYSFDPKELSFEEQARHAPKLSELWGRFHESPDSYREALRALLTKDGGTEMLYCDGGMLFLQDAKDPKDKTIGLESIKKCSLSEIQHTPYFYTIHKQAVNGVDTLALQFRMLTKPKYQVFIVPHALTLGQDYSFVYPLLVQDEMRYVPRVTERIVTEKDLTALSTLLLALYYAATPDAERSLRSISEDKVFPSSVRSRAKEMIDRIASMRATDLTRVREWITRNGAGISVNATEKDLRSQRRRRMRSISDEALMELDIYTLLIYQAFK